LLLMVLAARPTLAEVPLADLSFGPPGRSPKGLFRLVHNCE